MGTVAFQPIFVAFSLLAGALTAGKSMGCARREEWSAAFYWLAWSSMFYLQLILK